MPDSPLFDTERQFFDGLQALVRHRAAEETALAGAYQQATEAAEKEAQKSRKSITAARKAWLDAEEARHAGALEAAAGQSTAARETADQKRFEVRKRTVDQYSAALDKARDDYKNRLWTLDSILEAAEGEAKAKFEELRRKGAAAGKKHDELWAGAADLLAKAGQSRPGLEADAAATAPDGEPLAATQDAAAAAEKASAHLRASLLPKVAGAKGVLLGVGVGLLLGAALGFLAFSPPTSYVVLAAGAVLGVVLWVVLGIVAKGQAKGRATLFADRQGELRLAVERLKAFSEEQFAEARRKNAEKHAADRAKADGTYGPKIDTLEKQLAATLAKIDAEHAKATAHARATEKAETHAETERHGRDLAEATARFDAELAAGETVRADKFTAATAARDERFGQLSALWFAGLDKAQATVDELARYGGERFPEWAELLDAQRPLPGDAPAGIRVGARDVDLLALPDGLPFDHRLNVEKPLQQRVPSYLPFPSKAAALLKASGAGRQKAVEVLQSVMLRFLTGLPPGKVRFTIIDPVGLGENFAAFMHLADYDEKLVTARIWTEPGQIEQRLTDLTEHMENVIQKYLRNQYKSIEDYNTAAGEVAEPYRVLVIANFPTNFTADAARRLVSILNSGPACGVCTLMSLDTAAVLPRDFNPADLEAAAFTLEQKHGRFEAIDPLYGPFPLQTESPPDPAVVAAIVRRIGEASRTAARVEVPFDYILPPAGDEWRSSAAKGISVPIGRAGATRRQLFALGRGTAQHALVAGKTGSGKSTLLHALVTNLSLMYSPDEVELYMIDFKKGVEFQAYATHKLPHARVIAIESEREFGLSVLQRLDGILRERGEQFRQAGVNDLAGFRNSRPDEVTPRILFVVDEFQEFFVEDDKLAQEATLLLDRLVRQGRAFGVHCLLGSQTLGGAFSLARTTIDQMAVRIALQCSEADAQLILSKDNSAARLLNRPGEAIYNDANGLVEGNDPFQVVWLSDDRREELLEQVREKAADVGKSYPPPLVFEGSAAADLGKNADLARLLDARADAPTTPPVLYFGDPVAIKEPTSVTVRPQSAANVLILGQNEESALGLFAAGLVSLAARGRPADAPAPVTLIDGTPDDSDFYGVLANAASAVGLGEAVVGREGLKEAIAAFAAELARRQSGETADRAARFLFVQGLHRLRDLRKPEDDFGMGRRGAEKVVMPGELFATLLRDGPPVGLHVVVWCDTLTNFNRALDRSGLKEFAFRVLFQMSPADSSHLLDSPAASRLGKHRALLAEEGAERPEKFRPYGLPGGTWLRTVGDKLGAVVPA